MLWLTLLGRLKAIKDDTVAILAAVAGVASASVPNAVMASNTSNTRTGATTYATVTGFATSSLNGFTFAADTLTCTSPGVYDLVMQVPFETGASGGEVSYQLNAAAEVVLVVGIQTGAQAETRMARARIVLANNDTLKLRLKTLNAAETIRLAGNLGTAIQVSLVRVSL